MSEMEAAVDDLDDDITDEDVTDEEEQYQRLDDIGQSLAKRRSEYMEARYLSGIEEEWLEDEEHYEGIDDVNRGEHAVARRTKPLYRAAVDTETDEKPAGSTVFFNVTGPYCDAAAARVGDMLLPTDDKGWSIKPTPIPEMAAIAEGKFPARIEKHIRQAHEQLGDPADTVAKTMQDVQAQAKEEIAEANEKAQAAEAQIEDWHVECQYHAEMRQVIEDAAKIGTGVLKGPVPMVKRRVAYINGSLVTQEELVPVSFRIDPWNFYPDMGCGTNIHNGGGTFERDYLTHKALAALIDQPGYLPEQIMRCLDEGPMAADMKYGDNEQNRPNHELGLKKSQRTEFEIWYYHGQFTREDIEAAGCECPEGYEYDQADMICEMVNNHVIKMTPSYVAEGGFPYDVMVWKRRTGMPFGIGVARQIRTPQRVINGAARALMDNAGIASGPQVLNFPGMADPQNGVYEVVPWKHWIAGEDIDDPRMMQWALQFIAPPMMQEQLTAIINLGMKLAEDVTGLPMLMQGQMANQTPDTVGGMQILNNNASTVLRRIARLFDDLITEPHIRRYYAYLLEHGEDDNMKGDFSIDARGSSALVERDIQNQNIMQLLQIAANPIYKKDPSKVMDEYLRSVKLDVKNFEYDDEEWQQLVARLQQPQDSSAEVAKIRAEVEMRREQMRLEDAERDRQHEERLKSIDQEFDAFLKSIEVDMAEAKQQGDKEMQAEDLKAKLQTKVMELRAQLQAPDKPAPQVTEPAFEPPGRAKDGHAYTQ